MSLELAVAIAAAVAAALALAACAWLSVRVKRLRAAQRSLLGGGRADIVDFAVSLQGRIDDLHRADEASACLLSFAMDRLWPGSFGLVAAYRGGEVTPVSMLARSSPTWPACRGASSCASKASSQRRSRRG